MEYGMVPQVVLQLPVRSSSIPSLNDLYRYISTLNWTGTYVINFEFTLSFPLFKTGNIIATVIMAKDKGKKPMVGESSR
ncbi:hypothetical protein ABK046_47045, partial [Streptomyces caeruleatus]